MGLLFEVSFPLGLVLGWEGSVEIVVKDDELCGSRKVLRDFWRMFAGPVAILDDGRDQSTCQPGGFGGFLDEDGSVPVTFGLLLHLDVSPAQLSDSVIVDASSSNHSGDGVTWHAHLLDLSARPLPASIWEFDDFLILREVAPVGEAPQPLFFHRLVVEAAGDGGPLGCGWHD